MATKGKPAETTAQPAAPAVKSEPKGTRTVTVACKFPQGIVLQLCRADEYLEEGLNGSRKRIRFDKVGPKFVVRGPAMAADQVVIPPKALKAGFKRPQVEGGYALTPNIPADFWEQWLAQNKDNPLVVNQMIFAHAGRDHIEGLAADRHEFKSGFEPIEPDGDARIPQSTEPNVQTISTYNPDVAA